MLLPYMCSHLCALGVPKCGRLIHRPVLRHSPHLQFTDSKNELRGASLSLAIFRTNGLQPNSHSLQPKSNGLQPNSDTIAAISFNINTNAANASQNCRKTPLCYASQWMANFGVASWLDTLFENNGEEFNTIRKCPRGHCH